MFQLDEVLSIYKDIEEIEMSPQFAWVYSQLVKEVDRKFWLGVRKHALRNWYEKNKELIRKEVKVEYKEVKIPKRKGGKRVLHIPSKELKEKQRAWLDFLYIVFPSKGGHAYAFEKRKSIKSALEKHVGNYLFMKFDILNAFPSVKEEVLSEALDKFLVPYKVRRDLIRDCFYKGLPQGAPTSGKLFNLAMKIPDGKIDGVIHRVGGKYTRYADDILISFPKGKKASVSKTTEILERYLGEAGLKLNKQKIRVFKERAKVLGCVVHENRVTISRRKRRLYRAMLHNNKTGKRKIRKDKINGIKGWLNAIYTDESVPGINEAEF